MHKPFGAIPAMVTPLDEQDRVNVPALRELTEHLIQEGVHGLFVLGSQGEFWAFDDAEKRLIVETVLDQNAGRLPVYAGVGAMTTREAKRQARLLENLGVSALSILTPFFIVPNPDELYSHFAAIANAIQLPIILYSNPGRTHCAMPPALVGRLSTRDGIVGIKDSSGDLSLTAQYMQAAGERFAVLAGNDALILATLLYGGAGCVAAAANVLPRLVAGIYDQFVAGDFAGALESQRQVARLRRLFTLGTFPVVIKEALTLMGFPVGGCRAPVGPLSHAARKELGAALKQLNVI